MCRRDAVLKIQELADAQRERVVRVACRHHMASWRTVVISTGEAEVATERDAIGTNTTRPARKRVYCRWPCLASVSLTQPR